MLIDPNALQALINSENLHKEETEEMLDNTLSGSRNKRQVRRYSTGHYFHNNNSKKES